MKADRMIEWLAAAQSGSGAVTIDAKMVAVRSCAGDKIGR
jgi:hypothetical protein